MKNKKSLIIFSSLFLVLLSGAGTIDILFPEVEENNEEVFQVFNAKNDSTLLRLENQPGFNELRLELTSLLDQNKEERKRTGVSFTESWAYNFYRDNDNPKGVFRRVEKNTYKQLKEEERLDDVPWEIVVDLDAFINSHDFPSEVTEPSSGPWECLREDETREYKRCLVGFSQSGGDRNVYYEFDFESLTWVKDSAFEYEVLGRTSFQWLDENQLIVSLDEFTYHNANNPEDAVTYEEAIEQGMISIAGYPRKTYIWNRGETFSPTQLIYEGRPGAQFAGVWSMELEGQPKDQFFAFYDYISRSEMYISFGSKLEDGSYSKTQLNIPPDVDKMNFLALDKTTLSIFFGTKSEWNDLGTNDLARKTVQFLENGEIAISSYEVIYSLSEDQGIVSSVSILENEEYDPSDDQIIIGTTYNVSDNMVLLNRDGDSWRSSYVEDPLNLTYKSMRIWRDEDDDSLRMSVSNFLNPRHEYILTSDGNEFDYELLEAKEPRFDSLKYRVEQLWVDRGQDQNGRSIRVPYFIVFNPDKVNLNDPTQSPSPTLLYAYGGFSVGMKPFYMGSQGHFWLDKGGVYVIANIRGGNEFGAYWHQSALKENRVNTYGDFFAVSEDLIARGITSPQKLAIEGGSNGGLLTGVAMTQRPELYKAVISSVPLLDMMRYHRLYVGSSWMDEYGDPDGDEREFWLQYSPLQNLQEGVEYPRAYITTNRYDDRVHPAHARKFALKLDELGSDYYYYENPNGGHGGDALTSYEEALPMALRYMYLYTELNM